MLTHFEIFGLLNLTNKVIISKVTLYSLIFINMETSSQGTKEFDLATAGAAAMRKLYGLPEDATEEEVKEAQRTGRIEALAKLGLTTDATEEEVLQALDRERNRERNRAATLEVLREAEAAAE